MKDRKEYTKLEPHSNYLLIAFSTHLLLSSPICFLEINTGFPRWLEDAALAKKSTNNIPAGL
jgi:hypothetical protein